MNTKWYCFYQNPSGGEYIGPEYILVQANSASDANDLVQNHGVYFDGCDDERDCECCGDRWDRHYHEDYSTDSPCVYGEVVGPSDNVKLVYSDGRVEGGNKSCAS